MVSLERKQSNETHIFRHKIRNSEHHHQSIMSQEITILGSSVSLIGYHMLTGRQWSAHCLTTYILHLRVVHPAGTEGPSHSAHAQHSACPAFGKRAINTRGMTTGLRRPFGRREWCSDEEVRPHNSYFQALQVTKFQYRKADLTQGRSTL